MQRIAKDELLLVVVVTSASSLFLCEPSGGRVLHTCTYKTVPVSTCVR
jgi:hypothetical protein